MMADTKPAPLASAPMFTVPQIDLSKVNPTGVGTDPNITADYKKMLEAQQKYADELEQRYARPNLFKVAAGFAKPQLGGFLASLGSASEALGEQVELQRAIAPTVAQMRAEIAKGNIALGQGVKAAGIAGTAAGQQRIVNPIEAADIASLTQGPGSAASAGQTQSTAQQNQLVQLIAQGLSYTEITGKLPKAFVDQNIDTVLNMYPHLKPPKDMPSTFSGAKSSGATTAPATKTRIPGVPDAMVESLPIAPQLAAQAQTVESMQQERDKTNATLSQQANAGESIFSAATNLYKAAANPALAGAFGVFEKGDPLSIIGKAVESGSFPAVIASMRTYITQARLGADQEKRAISDLQIMEKALADLNTKINNGVINPTDVRTMFESESIPGVRNTQDAFLRGIARIGSEALARYEAKKAFDLALQDPNFNVQTWATSPYLSSVQENAKKRTQALILNPATANMPKFMQQGLEGSFRYEPPKQSSGAGGSKPTNRPNERTINGQVWVRQPDGSYAPKG